MPGRFGLREKLFCVCAGVIAVASALSYVALSARLEGLTERRLHEDARARVGLVAREVDRRAVPLSLATPEADDLADELAAAARARVTLFDGGGTVVGDSELDLETLRDLASRTESPEAKAALGGDESTERRFSTASQRVLVFAATPLVRDGHVAGAARVGVPVDAVREVSANVGWLVAIGTSVALVLAFIVATVAARFASQGVRELAVAAKRMASGDLEARARPVEGDHLAELGRSLEQLADGLRNTLRELVGERDVLSGILTSMREGVLLVNREGRVGLLNPALREMLLLSDDDVGKLPIEIVRDAALHDLLDMARRSQAAVQAEIQVGGLKPRRLLVRAELLNVQPGGLLVVFYDVTDLRRLETLRRDFVANASHELRTPVTAIRSGAETLGSIPPTDVASSRRFLAIVERNAERLQNLIDDLLDLSKIESRELALSADAVDLGDVAEHVVALFAERAGRSRNVLSIEIDAGLPPARADARALEQVLQNLLDNAIKYGPASIVTVSAEAGEHLVRLKVTDTGPGIERKHLDRLFERFYRVDAGRSRQLGGTGLGLSIVKHLVEAMGGTVSVTSEVGKGTTFIVELPRYEESLLERAATSSPTPAVSGDSA